MKRIVQLVLFAVLLLPDFAQASALRVEAKFGPEWTFSIFIPDEEFEPEQELRDIYASLIHRRRGAYKIEGDVFHGRTFLQAPRGGWRVRISTDPGVYEVQTSPMTVRSFIKYQKTFQRDIFDNIKKIYGATPLLFVGGGHINIGLKEFAHNPPLLRNFIIDFYNHNELALGIFGYDTNNALPFCMMPKKYRESVLKELNWFAKEAKFYGNRPDEIFNLMDELFRNLAEEQGTVNDAFYRSWNFVHSSYETNLHSTREKFVDLNFQSAEYMVHQLDSARLEFRAIRPQASADVYRRQIQLLQARLDFLTKQNRDIIYKPLVKLQRINVVKHKLTPPVDPQEALRSFYIYVTETGEKWKNHRDYIWPLWITGGELQKFENSAWFREQERSARASCGGLLR
jgi:hypothetical protein